MRYLSIFLSPSHQVRAIVSHGSLSSYIVRSTALTSEFDICDNKPHVIQFLFTSAALQLTVDDNANDMTLFDAGTPNVVTNDGLYIGGKPSEYICIYM